MKKMNKLYPLLITSLLTLQGCGGSSGGFTQTGVKPVGEGDPNVLVNVTNSDPAMFESANIIADFENVPYMKDTKNGWVLTGIFQEVADWRGVTTRAASARVGAAAVSTCEIGGKDCDSNIGSILTPAFKVTSNYINFLMTGGATAVGVQVRLAGTETVLLSYQPNSCGKPHITNNDDWVHFDVRALKNQNVQLYIFDKEAGGCGFISFDHFYQSGSATGSLAASAGEPISGDGVSLPEDGISNIVGTFDDAVKTATSIEFGGEGWSATGTFSNPVSPGSWRGASVSTAAAKVGDGAFSSCSTLAGGCNSVTGTVTSPAFKVITDFIYLLAAGGSSTNSDVGVKILNASTGETLVSFTPGTCANKFINSDADWSKFDVSAIKGQTVKVQVFDNSTAECGFIAVDHIYQSNNATFNDAHGNKVIPKAAGVANIPLEFQTKNVTAPAEAFVKDFVIGNFDSPTAILTSGGWSATGDFVFPSDENAWRGTTAGANSAQVGAAAISTCEMNGNAKGCDASVGSLVSPLTKVKNQYLNFLMGGGNGTNPVGLRVLDSVGNIIHTTLAASCGPAFISGNDDWTSIDWSAIKNAKVKIQFFDEESSGCGFLSFDHLYQADSKPTDSVIDGGIIAPTDAQLKTIGFNTSLPYADSADFVVGDFDDALSMLTNGWTATGSFANPADAGAWVGTTRFDAAARIGKRAVSTCEMNGNRDGCDAPTGTLTSPVIQVSADHPFLEFMMAGGNGSTVGLRVLSAVDNTELASFKPNTCGPSHIDGDDDWHVIDLSSYAGQSVKVEVFDNEPGGCGFVSFDHIHFSAKRAIDPTYVKYPPSQAVTGVTLPANGFDQVIGGFDDAFATISSGWIATGDFANPVATNSWVGVAKNVRVGNGAVSTCEMNGNSKGCDGSVGTLTSPTFVVDATRPFLNILMSGGSGSNQVGFRVLDQSKAEIFRFTPNSCGSASIQGDQHWVSADLTASIGKTLTVEIFDNESAGCGFVSFDHLYMGSSKAQLP